ncbi:hypothetical protein Syun_017070 [Stephania yunnanensis]|uniref:Uncharacterized protein n=1 Tax=Stephania yunnanensis TaxID=152371 RepID=A0AAP0P2Q9_9MAGN
MKLVGELDSAPVKHEHRRFYQKKPSKVASNLVHIISLLFSLRKLEDNKKKEGKGKIIKKRMSDQGMKGEQKKEIEHLEPLAMLIATETCRKPHMK